MALLPSLSQSTAGSRQLPELLPAFIGQTKSQQKQTSNAPAQVANSTTLSQQGIDLSRQDALAERVDNLGSATIDAGKNFLNDFARSLFGTAADDFSITYDSASISAQSSVATSASHSVSAYGTSNTAAFSLNDSADFTGKGTITTKDGHRFSFEISVHFTSSIESMAQTTTGTAPADNGKLPDKASAGSVPTTGLNALFPGNVADLFRLFDYTSRRQPFQIPAGTDAQTGTATAPRVGEMTLRLLDLLAAPPANDPRVSKLYGDATQIDAAKKSA